ncbi:MAG: hypothetical protein KAX11_06930 [Candidatus Aminicenantes bacterium]|nr:hypothetical protein [Candidatus Aminicenantes bacterium]
MKKKATAFMMAMTFLCCLPYSRAAASPDRKGPWTGHRTNEIEQKLFEKINETRIEHQKRRFVSPSTRLSYQARMHAKEMHRFSDEVLGSRECHNSMDGTISGVRIRIAYPRADLTGENIALAYGNLDPVSAAIDNWMDDQDHRDILLGNWDRVGIGIFEGSRVPHNGFSDSEMTFYTIVADFVRLNSPPPPSAAGQTVDLDCVGASVQTAGSTGERRKVKERGRTVHRFYYFAGSRVHCSVSVKNRGTGTAENCSIESSNLPHGWRLEVAPFSVAAGGRHVSIDFYIHISPDAHNKKYSINLNLIHPNDSNTANNTFVVSIPVTMR